MILEAAIQAIRSHESELTAAGVSSAAVFGSVARGEESPESDLDIAVRLRPDAYSSGFGYFGLIDDLQRKLVTIVGRPVDIVVEPVRRESLRQAIERDRVIAF